MPLILDASTWTRSRLAEMLREQREGLQESLQNLEHWPHPIVDPASFRTARDLLTDAIALSDGIDETADPGLLVRIVNVQYNATLAAIDLMKSHSALLSRVPRARR